MDHPTSPTMKRSDFNEFWNIELQKKYIYIHTANGPKWFSGLRAQNIACMKTLPTLLKNKYFVPEFKCLCSFRGDRLIKKTLCLYTTNLRRICDIHRQNGIDVGRPITFTPVHLPKTITLLKHPSKLKIRRKRHVVLLSPLLGDVRLSECSHFGGLLYFNHPLYLARF